jgi:hypothetical protein
MAFHIPVKRKKNRKKQALMDANLGEDFMTGLMSCLQPSFSVSAKNAKPGDRVKIGDEITLFFGTNVLKVQVLSLEEHVKKDEAKDMYKVIQ